MRTFLMSCSWLVLPLLWLSACSLNGPATEERDKKFYSDSPPLDITSGPVESFPQNNSDLHKLALLWEQRAWKGSAFDFPIGPGDLLEISVLGLEELKSRTVRVSAEGLIFLTPLGQIQAAGLTEEQVKEGIRERLLKFMHAPHVSIFVKEYQSRQVAVLGAVARPGLYGLTSGADTLFSMITKAGGMTTGADPRIHLLPAEPVESDKARMIVSTLPDRILGQDPSPLILNRTEPILIDLQNLAYGGYQKYLSLPVRPGDVIMVPGGGQVLVEGWVEKPGAHSISPGLTVAGVVAAAGGPLFPADTVAVKVIRTDRGGGKKSLVVDLEKIKSGKEQDIVLQGGDIVDVSSTPGKLTLYGLYRFFTTVVSIGVGGNIPIFR